MYILIHSSSGLDLTKIQNLHDEQHPILCLKHNIYLCKKCFEQKLLSKMKLKIYVQYYLLKVFVSKVIKQQLYFVTIYIYFKASELLGFWTLFVGQNPVY
jgi:hypothetical protein